MTASQDFMKPFESMKSLMTAQAEAISKTVAQQQKAGEEMASFIKAEMDKAQVLKSPEDVLKFNVESGKAFFELLKSQGDAFNSIAEETRAAMMKEISTLGK